MSEDQDMNQTLNAMVSGEPVWIPYNDKAAFRWIRIGGNWQLDGMVLYGDVTREALNAIPLAGDNAPTMSVPTVYATKEVPTREHLEAFWEGKTQMENSIYWYGSRRKGESADDFYKRVANLYEICSRGNPRNTTTALASVAEVKFSTAVHWVREARKRGFLAPSKKQLARRKGEGK